MNERLGIQEGNSVKERAIGLSPISNNFLVQEVKHLGLTHPWRSNNPVMFEEAKLDLISLPKGFLVTATNLATGQLS